MLEDKVFLTPGVMVIHPEHPEWGTGHVQSSIHNKVVVNFSEAGKKVIDLQYVDLELFSA